LYGATIMESGKTVQSNRISPSALQYQQVSSRHAAAEPGSAVMGSDSGPTTGTGEEPLSPDTTIELLELAKEGDAHALDRLLERCVPALRRWAHGRLPQTARGMNDTADIVQDTIISAMRHLEAFESRHQGALQAYLRQAVMNRIRDVIRHHKRRPEISGLSEGIEDEATSPLEAAIGAENLERYERALQRLKPIDREAIIGRLEMLYPYDELATVLGRPSAAAARMAVTRAMKRLAEEMQHV
jgi:RNA polymerase sigma factor (sigma-70 family)